MPRRKEKPHAATKRRGAKEIAGGKYNRAETPLVSGRWLLATLGATLAAAVLCGWLALCLLFWQGSWQLLYHPKAAVGKTPASAGLAFEPVDFAATETGEPRLSGWWIAAPPGAQMGRWTVLFLHGQDGNIGDNLDALARLHAVGVNLLAFDYRGYGQSQFARPSETHWQQDADWALAYLEGTRHIDAGAIVLYGEGLGANLAIEVAAAHSELAGVIADSPIPNPVRAIFTDVRARLVPAHLLVRDRYDPDAAAAVRLPVLWIQPLMHDEESRAYAQVTSRKMMVSIAPGSDANEQFEDAAERWLDSLVAR